VATLAKASAENIAAEEAMRMKPFHELQAETLNPNALQEELASKGYALIRGLLPRGAVRSVLTDVTTILSAADWLERPSDPVDRIPVEGAAFGDPDPVFKRVYQQVFNLESFHALPHQPPLQNVMRMLVGDEVLVHPKPIGRLIFPSCERLVVNPHQDYEFMGGDPEFFTVWIPLHDCPTEVGPLKVLEGSHQHGIQQHQRENLHVPEISMETVAGGEWAGGRINAGDVLLFHSLTVHAATPNVSTKMRLSIDCRFQDARRTLNPSNLVFAGDSGKSWDKTYADWKSDKLKFYWRNLPLSLKPSKLELQQMALSAESPSARTKYARMASQLA
jgi:hypothetical protein